MPTIAGAAGTHTRERSNDMAQTEQKHGRRRQPDGKFGRKYSTGPKKSGKK